MLKIVIYLASHNRMFGISHACSDRDRSFDLKTKVSGLRTTRDQFTKVLVSQL